MAKINILEPSVFNKIAAGEVVERPASVVKELVENSIDAGATEIDIEIINGGISLIQVSDNGCGIESGEIVKAFLPHATSKISNANDLENILTLGFRGEALSSIASVSEIILTTKTKEEDSATVIKVNGGTIVEQSQTGAPNGTQIQVKNLFYNIPVRYKFLKKPKQEEMAISEILSRLILANPSIAFKYIADGKIVYQSNGQGLENALYTVYGSKIMDNILPINSSIGDMKITGFICKPTFSKPNTTYQTVIINGRYVSCKLISTAVGRVYDDYLMSRAFPFFVLNINLPIENVDVNVHPNKLEVRFKDQQNIFGAIHHTIDNTLMEYRTNTSQQQNPESVRISAENTTYSNPIKNEDILSKFIFAQPTSNFSVQQDNHSALTEIIIEKKVKENQEQLAGKEIEKINSEQIYKDEIKEETSTTKTEKVTPQPMLQQFLFNGNSKNFDMLAIKIVGKIFNTFIIVEVENKVFIIDQHAAHERILYDKLVSALKKGEFSAQPMLIPYILETNNIEHQFVLDNLDNLEKLGFDIEDFGSNSFKVSTIPHNLPDLQIGVFFNDILKDMNTILIMKTKDLVLDKLAQTACKHAVKGGDDLNKEEISSLLENIATGNVQLQCPHGRPFVIELTRNDLDKWFKRTL